MCDLCDELVEYGVDIGIDIGIDKTKIEFINKLATKLHYTLDQCFNLLDIPEDQWEYYKSLLDM